MSESEPAKTPDALDRPVVLRGMEGLWEWLRHRILGSDRVPRIGLALGSGAARGVAHIGVLSVFHELKIPISYLSGSSSGSFVGALYAGGLEGERLVTFGRKYRWRDAAQFNYRLKMGLASNERMASYLEQRIGNPRFEDLRIPFYVVATNLTTGALRVFDKGPVIPAVLASCAIPGIFAPIKIDGELYCDGGLLVKIPCQVLRDAGAEIVIGVELGGLDQSKPPATFYEVITRVVEISRLHQINSDFQAADLIIRPEVDSVQEFDFGRNDFLIERGKEAAFRQLRHWSEITGEQILPAMNQTESKGR